MSGIDQVIARARQGNVGFTERRQFKLARNRAIEKLRRFALADPYFYILELIQAAVAGGAEFVDISCGGGDVLVSWTGGVIREDELAQLFDFLFASKERVDLAHVRSLALGVNALMLFEPEEVVIESGDGTPGGTTRMVVRAGADQVEVGRADGVLTGTYVRATRLDRRKVAEETGRHGDDDGGLEFGTVEGRCLSAPVPLVFNGTSLFGWSRHRVPNLFGHTKVCQFDEGDLYGAVGLTTQGASFRLMTHGVWVQSYEYPLIPNHAIGGIVCFDRLHKTVDHSGFVRDDRFEELWVRLRPYAEAVVGGTQVDVGRITNLDGLAYTTAELRALVRQHPRVVIFPAEILGDEARPDAAREQARAEATQRVSAIARVLDAELLRVADTQVDSVRVLGDRNLLIWRPGVLDDADLRFYTRPLLGPPAGPYVLPVVDLEVPTREVLAEEVRGCVSLTTLFNALSSLGRLGPRATAAPLEQLRAMIGETGSITAKLYGPAEPGPAARGLLVRVTSQGRLLGGRVYTTAHTGRVLDVELPTAMPTAMCADDRAVVWAVAERFAARSVAVLREQDQRTLSGLGVGRIEAGSGSARLALEVLARATTTRLRHARPGAAGPGLSFSMLHATGGFDPFSLPLLRTLAGRPLSLRELALICDSTGGLVYGVIPEVPSDLDGLDRDRILELDAASEQAVLSLVGDAGYVRVDARDVLAEAEGVQIRDVAVGLREYPEFPLLVEGAVELLAELDDEARDDLLTLLLDGLCRRMLGEADEPGADPLELEEHRRQAVRHLQWYVCHEWARTGATSLARRGLLELPLFVDLDGAVWGVGQVLATLASTEGLLVHYSHRFASAELGAISAAARAGHRPGEGRPSSLGLSYWGYQLLAPLGRTRLAFDFDLDDVEAAQNPLTASTAFLVEDRFSDGWGAGVLGIPAQRLPACRIQLRTRGREVVSALDEFAHRYGIVGSIEVAEGGRAPEELLAALEQRATALLGELVRRRAEFDEDPGRHEAALQVLLGHAAQHLSLTAGNHGLTIQVATPLATRILALPLFDIGLATLVSGERMLERFRQRFEGALFDLDADLLAPIDWSAEVVASTPAVVREWLDTHLQAHAVAMPASSGSTRAGASEGSRDSDGSSDSEGSSISSDGPSPAPTAASVIPVVGDRQVHPADQRLDPEALAWNIEHWLQELRPDRRSHRARTRVSVTAGQTDDALLAGGDARIEVSCVHPLTERVLASPTPANLAWVLLAVYARINATSGMVSNNHEGQFQGIISHQLLGRGLQVWAP